MQNAARDPKVSIVVLPISYDRRKPGRQAFALCTDAATAVVAVREEKNQKRKRQKETEGAVEKRSRYAKR